MGRGDRSVNTWEKKVTGLFLGKVTQNIKRYFVVNLKVMRTFNGYLGKK